MKGRKGGINKYLCCTVESHPFLYCVCMCVCTHTHTHHIFDSSSNIIPFVLCLSNFDSVACSLCSHFYEKDGVAYTRRIFWCMSRDPSKFSNIVFVKTLRSGCI
uniref:Uncharacterized protein n=1 Tax=Setaria viridis TaxID=4556 RepID=A0A4U6TN00_SETVI|nr:hypothetical protein SEVIR_7G087000v2 [Setaria viridis]